MRPSLKTSNASSKRAHSHTRSVSFSLPSASPAASPALELSSASPTSTSPSMPLANIFGLGRGGRRHSSDNRSGTIGPDRTPRTNPRLHSSWNGKPSGPAVSEDEFSNFKFPPQSSSDASEDHGGLYPARPFPPSPIIEEPGELPRSNSPPVVPAAATRMSSLSHGTKRKPPPSLSLRGGRGGASRHSLGGAGRGTREPGLSPTALNAFTARFGQPSANELAATPMQASAGERGLIDVGPIVDHHQRQSHTRRSSSVGHSHSHSRHDSLSVADGHTGERKSGMRALPAPGATPMRSAMKQSISITSSVAGGTTNGVSLNPAAPTFQPSSGPKAKFGATVPRTPGPGTGLSLQGPLVAIHNHAPPPPSSQLTSTGRPPVNTSLPPAKTRTKGSRSRPARRERFEAYEAALVDLAGTRSPPLSSTTTVATSARTKTPVPISQAFPATPQGFGSPPNVILPEGQQAWKPRSSTSFRPAPPGFARAGPGFGPAATFMPTMPPPPPPSSALSPPPSRSSKKSSKPAKRYMSFDEALRTQGREAIRTHPDSPYYDYNLSASSDEEEDEGEDEDDNGKWEPGALYSSRLRPDFAPKLNDMPPVLSAPIQYRNDGHALALADAKASQLYFSTELERLKTWIPEQEKVLRERREKVGMIRREMEGLKGDLNALGVELDDLHRRRDAVVADRLADSEEKSLVLRTSKSSSNAESGLIPPEALSLPDAQFERQAQQFTSKSRALFSSVASGTTSYPPRALALLGASTLAISSERFNRQRAHALESNKLQEVTKEIRDVNVKKHELKVRMDEWRGMLSESLSIESELGACVRRASERMADLLVGMKGERVNVAETKMEREVIRDVYGDGVGKRGSPRQEIIALADSMRLF